jgi:hypothetical protein
VAYFEREYQDSVSRTEAIANVETAKAEIARLTAALAEANKRAEGLGEEMAERIDAIEERITAREQRKA